MSNILTRNAKNKDFSRNPKIHHSRSVFKEPNRRFQTMNAGWLVPIYLQETTPGETWEVDMSIFARLMPQVAPVMDNVMIKTYFFWERNANLWDNFEKMMGRRDNPNDTIDYTVPTITIPEGGFKAGTIYDYLKVPIKRGKNRKISALPYRMYNRVYNKFFRSEQLQDEVTENHGDADDSYSTYTLLKKNKMPDYFTRNLIDTQLGDGVGLPLGISAPVIGNGNAIGLKDYYTTANEAKNLLFTNTAINNNPTYGLTIANVSTSTPKSIDTTEENVYTRTTTSGKGLRVGLTENANLSGLIADLSDATMASIISLRQALALQRTLEMDNINGTRYTEILQGRYGVTVPDAFFNRPIYLGGTSSVMSTLPVAQTSSTDNTTPQGNLTGNTLGSDGGNVIRASLPDFGYIMGIAVITTEQQYQYGLPRLYDRITRYDFYHPEFNGIGDQATYNSEIFLQDEDVVDDEGTPVNNLVFGYNERLAEYKTIPNEICGEVRSNADETLDVWHYAGIHDSLPTLNSDFIEDDAEANIARTLAVQYKTDENGNVLDGTDGKELKYATQALVRAEFNTKVYRGMPVYNLPQISGL